MKRSDFMLAGQQDRERYIVRPEKQIPLTMLVPGSESHLVSTKEFTVSFLTMKAGSVFDVHSHLQSQCMIVLEGKCDEIIDGKIYSVSIEDVLYLPANVPHGAFIEEDCRVIDVFALAARIICKNS